jgi:hypothetical protein
VLEEEPPITDPRLRNGLIFGGILAAIGILSSLAGWRVGEYTVTYTNGSLQSSASAAATALGCVIFLVRVGILFVAGMMTAKVSGSARGASATGLIAGLVGSFFSGVVSLILIYALWSPSIPIPAGSGITQEEVQSVVLAGGAIASLVGLVIDGGIGAGVAALGGLVGRAAYEPDDPLEAEPEPEYSGAVGDMYAGLAAQYPAPGAPRYVPQYAPDQLPPIMPLDETDGPIDTPESPVDHD